MIVELQHHLDGVTDKRFIVHDEIAGDFERRYVERMRLLDH